MASLHPTALDPEARSPTPLLIIPSSLSSSRTGSQPKPILGAKSSEIATTQISSLAHTLRPSPQVRSPHTLQASPAHSAHSSRHPTLKSQLLSYRQMLAQLQPPSSLGTATVKPPSRHALARLRVDELDFEVCVRCGERKAKEAVEMIELEEWGLQLVCKRRCDDHEEQVRPDWGDRVRSGGPSRSHIIKWGDNGGDKQHVPSPSPTAAQDQELEQKPETEPETESKEDR